MGSKYGTSQTQSTIEDYSSIIALNQELKDMKQFLIPKKRDILNYSSNIIQNIASESLTGLDKKNVLNALNESYYGIFIQPFENASLGFEKNVQSYDDPWPQDYKISARYNF